MTRVLPRTQDGIDVTGERIVVRNCTIQNFDDSIAVKPQNQDGRSKCTQNVLIEQLYVHLGVGISIGSVCVRV